MACLHSLQTGAIKASLRQVGWTVTTPSVTAVPDAPESNAKEPLLGACGGNLIYRSGPGTTGYQIDVQPEQSLSLLGCPGSRVRSDPRRESRPQRFTRPGA
jgi:hypothetical protein